MTGLLPGAVALAPAKLNLALVVGPLKKSGKHELATVFQRISLADRIELEPAPELEVSGFAADTIVRSALEALAKRAGVEPGWRVSIEKEVPVAAGLGGGSSDAATALRLANATLAEPFTPNELIELARPLGADIAFFCLDGPQLGQGDGSTLRSLSLPQDYSVLLVLPAGVVKPSTAEVYRAFDERRAERGFAERRAALLGALDSVRRPSDLALLPPNDLAASPLGARLAGLGAFRADVSGAGPAVYGLFEQREEAERAARALKGVGEVWLSEPSW
ncbi:MAG: 4-(cytidine 5'-diphospho)-2-C-methyl-D-erythritol kinase [Gaiellaceae bacterium]